MTGSFQSPSPLAGEGLGRGGRLSRKAALGKAKHMRAHPTDAERALWYLLRAERLPGFKFRRQVPIDHYIADFICFEHRLIIEADGSQHAESKSDGVRDDYLKAQGFRVLRLWNNDILTNPEGVLAAILDATASSQAVSAASSHAERTPLPSPPPQGGRGKLETA